MRSTMLLLVGALAVLAGTSEAATLDRVRASDVFNIGDRVDAAAFASNNDSGEPASRIGGKATPTDLLLSVYLTHGLPA